MTVRRDPDKNNKWVADFYFTFPDGCKKRIKRVSPVNTRRGAEAFERQLREELLNPSQPKNHIESPKLVDFQEQFIDGYAVANNKASEVKSKKGIIRRYLLPVFGNMRLEEIGVLDIEKFKANLQKGKRGEKGLSKKTVNNVLAVLSKMLKYAKKCEVLSEVPDIEMVPKVPKPDFDWFRPAEANRLLIAAMPSSWYEMIHFAIRTGLRYGELCELRWNDFDPDTHVMTVRRNWVEGEIETPKNGKPRDIPIPNETWKMLLDYRQFGSRPDDLVFLSPIGTRRIRRRAEVGLKRTCKRADLRHIGWHVCRHTFASHLVLAGRQMAEIQKLLGHADISMTMRYAHVGKSQLKVAMDALEEAVPLVSPSKKYAETADESFGPYLVPDKKNPASDELTGRKTR